jgi:hypothetical protein
MRARSLNADDRQDVSLRRKPDQHSPISVINRLRNPLSESDISHNRWLGKLTSILSDYSPIILFTILFAVGFHTYQLIQQTTGGDDLLHSDIPKSIMILQGQDPYSVQPWSAPYPPLLLLTVAGIIRFTTSNFLQTPSNIVIISQNIRVAGLFANALVSFMTFVALRVRGRTGIEALIPASLFAALPAVNASILLYWFHSDIIGYPILALSLLFLTSKHYFTGTTLLAVSAIYKIHPILALPLVLVWLGRRCGLKQTLPTLLSTTTILGLGLVLPFELPGYAESVLGFNLANTGTGTNTFSIFNLIYGITPGLGLQIPTAITDQVWVGATASLFTIVLAIVWRFANRLDPLQIVLLGLTAWLIPLKMLFTAYLIWALIPVLMLGRLRQAIVLAGLLQAADTMAYWSSFPAYSPIPELGTVYGFFLTSLVYCTFSVLAMITALMVRNISTRKRDIVIPAEDSSRTVYPIIARATLSTRKATRIFQSDDPSDSTSPAIGPGTHPNR